MLRLIDVSRWQDDPASVPWGEVDGGFVRVTYGLHVDPLAEEHLWRGRKAGKLLGGYHWLDCSPGAWGLDQGEFFSRAVGYLAIKDGSRGEPLALAVDVEPYDPRRPDPPDRVVDALAAFLLVATKTRPCAVYLNFNEARRIEISGRGRRALPDDLSRAPLWLADWTPPYVVPKPWDRYAVLQTGEKGGVDRDVYDGDATAFRREFGLCL